MSSVVRLALHPGEHAKVTPLEVLRDFADATAGWSYLEEDSHHYAEEKNVPGLVIRRRIDPSTHVDLAFASPSEEDDAVELAVLDRPGSEAFLSSEERRALLDTFLAAMRDYLDERPDHVTLHLEREAADPPSS